MNYFINEIIKWIWAHKLVTLLLLVIAFGGIYYACRQKAVTDDVRREQEARSQEHQKAIDEAKTESNQAANLSNQAMENLNKVRQSNLNSYSNNYNAARERFCREIGGC